MIHKTAVDKKDEHEALALVIGVGYTTRDIYTAVFDSYTVKRQKLFCHSGAK
jgi:hypothetical protein